MSSIFVRIEQDVLDRLKGAGKVVETVAVTAVQAAVSSAKQAPLGTLAESLIQIFDGHAGLTGEQKMPAVVGALVPLAPTLIAGGGLPAITGSVENFVRELAQSAYNDLKVGPAKAATVEVARLAA